LTERKHVHNVGLTYIKYKSFKKKVHKTMYKCCRNGHVNWTTA